MRFLSVTFGNMKLAIILNAEAEEVVPVGKAVSATHVSVNKT